jgi:hypothetical protein
MDFSLPTLQNAKKKRKIKLMGLVGYMVYTPHSTMET